MGHTFDGQVVDVDQAVHNFLVWLRDHTDTFDPVMVQIVLDEGDPLMDDKMIDTLVAQWIEAR